MERTPISEATLFDLLRWLLRRYKRLHVVGESMTPTLQPGDTVLIDPDAYQHGSPSEGDVIAATHPNQDDLQIVKRIAFLEENGDCYLLSDNSAEGTDSRTFGAVPQEKIIGRVVAKLGDKK